MLVINEITRKTARDMQVRVGPSDLGNPCPHCLGTKMLAEGNGGPLDEENFSLYPWIGTAVHSYLEENVFQTKDYMHEQKLYVGDVEGYGPIKGTADLVGPGIVVDWKIVGLKKIKHYRLNGPPTQYRYQAQLYGRGCALAGFPVDSVAICFIPRDSGNVNDIFVHEEAYQEEMALAALARAAEIYNIALTQGIDQLPSADDCWVCNNNW